MLKLPVTKFNRLTLQWPCGISKRGTWWLCLCDCGTIVHKPACDVRSGNTKSCGCLNNEQRAARVRTHGKTDSIECEMWYRIKRRAKVEGLEFNLELDDIIIPDICPLLGIPLRRNKLGGGPDSPSLDRIDPTKGYIKGNVWVISMKANAAKNNLTLEEMQKLVKNWENAELQRR